MTERGAWQIEFMVGVLKIDNPEVICTGLVLSQEPLNAELPPAGIRAAAERGHGPPRLFHPVFLERPAWRIGFTGRNVGSF